MLPKLSIMPVPAPSALKRGKKLGGIYRGAGRCSAEDKHFRAVARGVVFVAVPSTGISAGVQTGRGLRRDECLGLRGEVLHSTCLEVVLLSRVSLYVQKHR